jgi:tetrahydromethanopterin S-methyltransferase subunit E
MGLSSSAIIVIVLIASLGAVATAAGIFGVLNPDKDIFKSPSSEQLQYMRQVREMHFDLIARQLGRNRKEFQGRSPH